MAGPCSRAVSGVGLRPCACWDRGFESHRGAWMFVLSVVCCQVEVSATDWSLVQRSPTYCGASLCVIKKPRKRGGYNPARGPQNTNPQWIVAPGEKYIYVYIYTECPRRNGQYFGRVFLMLKYTDITQNTYVQSWTVTEIKAREKCGLFAVPRTVPGSRDVIPIRCALSALIYSWLKRFPRCDCTCKVLGNPKNNYDVSASVFVVQFNGFMSLTSYFDVKYRY